MKFFFFLNYFFPVLIELFLMVQGLQRAEPVLGESPMRQLQWTPRNLFQEPGIETSRNISGSVQGQELGEILSIKRPCPWQEVETGWFSGAFHPKPFQDYNLYKYKFIIYPDVVSQTQPAHPSHDPKEIKLDLRCSRECVKLSHMRKLSQKGAGTAKDTSKRNNTRLRLFPAPLFPNKSICGTCFPSPGRSGGGLWGIRRDEMSSVEGQTGQEVLHNPSAGFFCCFAAPPFAGTINTNNMTGNTFFFS